MKIDSRVLLQVAILGLLEEGLHVSEVAKIANRTVGDVWHGMNQAEQNKQQATSLKGK